MHGGMEDRVQGGFVTKAEGTDQHDTAGKIKPTTSHLT
ncbi:hypothetical protein ACS15_5197 [Ralstonia insidiosa]|uniref:Uncharacterized protein n=1 Tax=Ralstonia insidiosa TaxID=190721 RepID=A0AAC9BK88_9RALS|nr:hypothetical protein ACS15_5197 [Ralstonia insidiosa]